MYSFFLKEINKKRNGHTLLMCRITVDGIETRLTMKTGIDLVFGMSNLEKRLKEIQKHLRLMLLWITQNRF